MTGCAKNRSIGGASRFEQVFQQFRILQEEDDSCEAEEEEDQRSATLSTVGSVPA